MHDVAAERRAIERICQTSGLRYQWLPPHDTQPRTDMERRVVYLPCPLPTWSDHEWQLLRAFIYHECGHHHPAQIPFVKLLKDKGLGMAGSFGNVMNALDDVWQEMVTSRDYPGAAYDLDYCQSHFCDKAAKLLADPSKKVDKEAAKVMGLMYKARCQWQPSMSSAFYDLEPKVDISHWDHLVDRINGIVDHPSPSEELLAIAREMFDSDDDMQSSEEAEQECKDKIEEAKKAREEAKKGKEEEEAGGSGSDKADKGEKGEPIDGEVSYRDLMAHNHEAEEIGHSPASLRIIYDHTPTYDYDPYPLEQIITGLPEEINQYVYGSSGNHYLSSMQRGYKDHKHIANSLRRLFQSTSQRRHEYQRERGKLTAKHVPRIMSGDPRIFHRNVERIDATADVYLLCDGSGSMGGMSGTAKYTLMGVAVTVLSQALTAAAIDHKVAVFSESPGYCLHYTIKDWYDKADADTIIERFGEVGMGCNADGDNILQAMRELTPRANKRKILIVLSDGQPASERDGDCFTFTQEVVKKCTKSGIECYGIGILDSTVERIYPESIVLEDSNDIEKCLVQVVKSKIMRGNSRV